MKRSRIRHLLLLLGTLGALGCGSRTSEPAQAQPAAPAAVAAEPAKPLAAAPAAVDVKAPAAADDSEPRALGDFKITFYYVVGEEEFAARAHPSGDDQALAAVASPELVTLYGADTSCAPIAEVTREYAYELTMQGTGKLRDGRVVNVWGPCNCPRSPCWKAVQHQWGTGGNGRPLQPFRTVAVNLQQIKVGTLLYVPMLEGQTMPGRPPWGGFVHDGCVVADDTGDGVRQNQLDLFVGRRGWFFGMDRAGSHARLKHVPVFDGSKICERQGRKVSRKTGSI